MRSGDLKIDLVTRFAWCGCRAGLCLLRSTAPPLGGLHSVCAMRFLGGKTAAPLLALAACSAVGRPGAGGSENGSGCRP